MRTSLILAIIGTLITLPAAAQKSRTAMTNEINSNFPDNTVGSITPNNLRTVTTDMVNSYLSLLDVSNVTNSTASTSNATGAVVITGGLGVGGAINGITLGGTSGKSLMANTSLTVSTNDGTLAFGASGKTLTVNNSITLAGTDATTITMPSTTDTVAGLAQSNTFTGTTNQFNNPVGFGGAPTHRVDAAGGTTAIAPLRLQSGTNLTTPVAGAFEYDGNALYATPNPANRGVLTSQQFLSLSANQTGANSNTAQPWFPGGGLTQITLPAATTYFFEGHLSLTRSVGTTSHTIALLFGGGATYCGGRTQTGTGRYIGMGSRKSPTGGGGGASTTNSGGGGARKMTGTGGGGAKPNTGSSNTSTGRWK